MSPVNVGGVESEPIVYEVATDHCGSEHFKDGLLTLSLSKLSSVAL